MVGAGKSTLLRLIAGLDRSSPGGMAERVPASATLAEIVLGTLRGAQAGASASRHAG
ncbi:hypothetical protein ACIG5E_16320 [Kitasatospora sp. NPDC053057]|uniref:hypothetical protein n=1 Tax=Kitasatospora sp. NPDC053057 TaxID=3364062 RepID=UPI0037CB1A99